MFAAENFGGGIAERDDLHCQSHQRHSGKIAAARRARILLAVYLAQEHAPIIAAKDFFIFVRKKTGEGFFMDVPPRLRGWRNPPRAGEGGLFVFVGGEGEVVAFDEIHEEIEQHRVDFLQAAVNAHALADTAVD